MEEQKEAPKTPFKCCPVPPEKRKYVLGVLILVLIAAYAVYVKNPKLGEQVGKIFSKNLTSDEAKSKAESFVKDNLVPAGTELEVKNVVSESGLYRMTINVGTQEVPVYLTKDGRIFFPQAMVISEVEKQAAEQKAAEVDAAAEAKIKSAKPEVKLFVMSYCPYGLQIERGIIPALETLKGKIDFQLEFVDYILHGQKEIDENLRQYCIQKEQPEKLNAYLRCFWKKSSGESAACLKTTGVNADKVTACEKEAREQFTLTEKEFNINKADNDTFKVSGSPTLVVNGTTMTSSRDSAGILKAICSGFENQPAECQAKLSSTVPGAGFDDQIAASGKTDAAGSGGSCH